MAEDPKDKKTMKEGLSEAAREALERSSKKSDAPKNPSPEVPQRDDERPVASEREAAVIADANQDHEGAVPAKNTPHGKEDIAEMKKPSPRADSDDEAPFKSYKKIDEHDREVGAHRGAGRADEYDARHKKPSTKRRTALLLAEYETPGACMRAAEKLRDAGYTHFDTHTPFPVHGMDRAMGLPDSKLGWIVLCGGLTGVTAAFSMMYWMNCVDYPLVIGGKPPNIASVPSMVPIMFELTILLSALSAVFGMFHLNKLPRHHHPIFESDRFARFSDDRFFVSVEAEDPRFKLDGTKELLERTKATFVEVVEEEVPA